MVTVAVFHKMERSGWNHKYKKKSRALIINIKS